ncbi:MAG: BlaI/MecI/CopY family transcriptional regulator [Gammaproteobacteria bacterium]|nr:BlaI/MecI/CopY family transcriptional regulator [Xanthomonadales bacterium]
MKLSEFELEVMTLFWKDKSSTAPEIHRKISKNKKVTYSTVKTIIDRLEQKLALKRVKNFGRTIVYSPAVKQEELQKPLIKKFIDKVFSGNPRLLINHLLEEDQLSKEDIEYLKTIINKKGK